MSERRMRCAIYTRKSSEEGLEQDFNSLHAQREACEAYVLSQRHEGWRAVAATYEDGGFSGGTLERPGLKKLLADIAEGQIDVVVVYKVDRLTRSLADFAKIVEIFDARQVSFVSVTQSFNTTSSMGRLTLNVLLSFAQFEREVTGERIRDKIAASKKKGMWMGGNIPLGYRVDQRRLVVAPDHAVFVRHLFERYLVLGSVDLLQRELHNSHTATPVRRTGTGRQLGGTHLGRGALYHLLQNPVYRGKIAHKGVVHEGMHEAIVPEDVWQRVQDMLAANRQSERLATRAKHPSLLAGLLFLDDGRRLIASHAVKSGVRYRYYRSAPNRADAGSRGPISIAADTLEAAVTGSLARFLRDPGRVLDCVPASRDPAHLIASAQDLAERIEGPNAVPRRAALNDLVARIEVAADQITIAVTMTAVCSSVSASSASYILTEPVAFARRGQELRIVVPGNGPPEPKRDPALIKAVGQAHRWWRDLIARRYKTLREIAAAYGTDERYVAHVIRLAFLSPDLTRRILDGSQPLDLTLHTLLWKIDLPVAWSAQLQMVSGTRASGAH